MKTSNIILLSILILVIFSIIFFVITVKEKIENEIAGLSTEMGNYTKTISLNEFAGIEVSGDWRVNIKHGQAMKIILKGKDSLEVQKYEPIIIDGIVYLPLPDTINRNQMVSHAEIIVPAAYLINCYGNAFVEIDSGVNYNLNIELRDNAECHISHLNTKKLQLWAYGKSRAFLQNGSIEQIEVKMNDYGNLEIHADINLIIGFLKGNSELSFRGLVNHIDLSIEKGARIEKRKTVEDSIELDLGKDEVNKTSDKEYSRVNFIVRSAPVF